jgi:selenide,water dikinase
MGARPISALNIVGFPDDKLDLEVLDAILRGGAEKVIEAGAVVLGGHSVRDVEIKFGLAATGVVDPARMITNEKAAPGDVLILSKPIGTGAMTAAFRKDKIDAAVWENALARMAQLNRAASAAMVAARANAATDITGFGLIGHATELADASGVTLEIEAAAVPLLDGAIELSRAGFVTRAAATNLNYVESRLENRSKAEPALFDLLIDAQTSGGLLIAMPESGVERYVAEMERAGAADGWTRIGSVLARSGQIGVRLV